MTTDAMPGNWQDFSEAKEAIGFMPLKELEALFVLPAPSLMSYSGHSLIGAVVLYFLGFRLQILQLLAFVVGIYGIIALVTNRSRAAAYREDCYKVWVRKRADSMLEELETENDQ
jgi:hypothetical protein